MQKDDSYYEVIISDSTCLIFFKNINRLDILKKLYGNITITPDVLDEYRIKDKDKLPEWIHVKTPKNRDEVNRLYIKLRGLGESSSIVLASENPNLSLLITDDRKARNYAQNSGLDIIGSIGIVRRARNKNIIKSNEEANDLFDELKNVSGWINNKLIEKIKYPVLNLEEG
jgi:predicted nucleic acid-binding protein